MGISSTTVRTITEKFKELNPVGDSLQNNVRDAYEPNTQNAHYPFKFSIFPHYVSQINPTADSLPTAVLKTSSTNFNGTSLPSMTTLTVSNIGRWSGSPQMEYVPNAENVHQEPYLRHRQLLATGDFDINQLHARARLPLITAVLNAEFVEVAHLLNDRRYIEQIDDEDESGRSALDYAFEQKNFPMARLLTSKGAKIADDMALQPSLLSELIMAGEFHLTREVALLHSRLKSHTQDAFREGAQYWREPLFLAIRAGNVELAALLANPWTLRERDNTGGNALHFAANAPDPLMLPALLGRLPADPEQRQLILNSARIDGRTPLIQAVTANRPTAVALLLKAGALINAVDQNGDSALHKAASAGYIEIGRLLLAAGARTDLVNRSQRCPAAIARHVGRTEFAQLLQAFAVQD